MPPKTKITKEMILHKVLSLTRSSGFEAVNARSIANTLQCSTRPIFTCYKNMEELKKDFLAFAYGYYEQYVADYESSRHVSPHLLLPLSYIQFAQEESQLFKLLFLHDMDLNMREAADFYQEPDNQRKAAAFSEMTGIETERAKAIFLDLFLYTHGIAVLTATKKIKFEKNSVEQMLHHVLSALIRQEKPDWKPFA